MNPAKTVARIREVAVAYGEAGERGDYKRSNRAYMRLVRLHGSLWKTDPESCRVLLPLLDDEEPAVRTWAAFNALDFERERAVRALESVARGSGELAVDAKYFLRDIDDGTLAMQPEWYGESV